jgi:hypothetical protein
MIPLLALSYISLVLIKRLRATINQLWHSRAQGRHSTFEGYRLCRPTTLVWEVA